MRMLGSAILLSLVLTTATAFAENPPAAGKADKKAISKMCSEQANAKGLHGKERHKFRSECKRRGGKPE